VGKVDDLTRGWLAGLVEGEGWIGLQTLRDRGVERTYPRISLQMTDEDVVRRAQVVTGVGQVNGPYSGTRYKACWRWVVNKRADVDMVLILIYPLMGARRQAKIRDCLMHNGYPVSPRLLCKLANHPMTPENTYISPGGHRFCIACYITRCGYPPKRLKA
jgi:hypothetical protein